MTQPMFHNYFRWVPVDDDSVRDFVVFAGSDRPVAWELIDDMDDRPSGALRHHVKDMVSRDLLVEDGDGVMLAA